MRSVLARAILEGALIDVSDCSRAKEPSVLGTEVVMYGLLNNVGTE